MKPGEMIIMPADDAPRPQGRDPFKMVLIMIRRDGARGCPPVALILLTNDDGFFGEGIQALFRALGPRPDLHRRPGPGEKRQLAGPLAPPAAPRPADRPRVYAVDGTPVDCVYLAMKKFLPRRPDLIISGMNPGPNLGQQDVTYSGTVAAAIQGTFLGPVGGRLPHRRRRGRFRPESAPPSSSGHRGATSSPPACRPGRPSTSTSLPRPQGRQDHQIGLKLYEPEIIEKKDPRDTSYFWIGREPRTVGDAETDVMAAHDGFIR